MKLRVMFDALATIDLAHVIGAAATAENLGRCGPGDGMAFLGDVRTAECLAHDLAVRGAKAAGDPAWLAHAKGLPLLPAAVGSYFRGLVFGS